MNRRFGAIVAAAIKREVREGGPVEIDPDQDFEDLLEEYFERRENFLRVWTRVRSGKLHYVDTRGRLNDFAKDWATEFAWLVRVHCILNYPYGSR